MSGSSGSFAAFEGVGHLLGGPFDPPLDVCDPANDGGVPPPPAVPKAAAVKRRPAAPVKRRPAAAKAAMAAPPPAAASQRRPAVPNSAGGAPPPCGARVKRRPSSAAYKARVRVIRGTQKQTSGRLQSSDMWFSRHTGKVMSKDRSSTSVAMYPGSHLQFWNKCLARARAICKLEHRFVPVGGKTAEGQLLLETTRALKRLWGGAAPQSPDMHSP